MRRVLLLLGALLAAQCQAAALRLCDAPRRASADEHDLLLRFAAVVRAELDASGQTVALVARSGVDLSRFGFRYSHAGVALQSGAGAPWAIRQLYYACDEGRPRIYDQGLAGFVLAGDADAANSHLALVFLPADAAAALERAARDDRLALALLGADYSANAYAFSERYQNCNQWLAELLAAAWGAPAAPSRRTSQAWLAAQAYAPSVFEVGPLMGLAAFVPLVRADDHPRADLEARRYRVSMPASVEAFVRATLPGATRIELCRSGRQVVVRRGWAPIAEGCRPDAADTLVVLD